MVEGRWRRGGLRVQHDERDERLITQGKWSLRQTSGSGDWVGAT